jgi:hypothetical protein
MCSRCKAWLRSSSIDVQDGDSWDAPSPREENNMQDLHLDLIPLLMVLRIAAVVSLTEASPLLSSR